MPEEMEMSQADIMKYSSDAAKLGEEIAEVWRPNWSASCVPLRSKDFTYYKNLRAMP